MQEIKESLKVIQSDVADIKVDVAKNTISLDYHIKRSDANEDRIKKLEYILIGLLGSIIIAAVTKWLIG